MATNTQEQTKEGPIGSPVNVKTTLNYCVPHGPIPLVKYITQPPPGESWMSFDIVSYNTTVHDARNTPMETGSSLDVHAFQFLRWPANEKTFDDEPGFGEGYYKEVQDLIVKNVEGATKLRVHVDQTEDSAMRRVFKHLPEDEANRLISLPHQRIRIINVWRPIANPVAHTPLAVADWRSVDHARDLVVTRKMLGPGKGEGGTYNVRHHKDHKWWYLRGMTPEECVLLKCADTVEEEAVAKMCLHTAFADHTDGEDKPKRQSIEVRCLVFNQA